MARIRKKDGKPFYEGAAKADKLQELEKQAVSHHFEAKKAWRGALDHARQAGEALNEAKRINGGRGTWTQWLDKHFCERALASRETARVYMRIARQWNDPRLEDARARGLTKNSIQTVLKILRGEKDRDYPKPTEQEWQKEEMINDLRKQFAKKLKELDYQEIEILSEGFEYYFWPKMYKDLRDTLCSILEYDYYYENRDTMEERRAKREDKRKVRRKVINALNKGRKKAGRG
ncbi:hypothetical protein [uncultured Gimesia sp.]|uniref:hypothetical protein n=1 Tax=uncultured Gimesia sp. TaxID=1678688 RepID=UPI0030DACFF7|tara:strand:+ start:62260 stop:62958 length:699 start_codon:yes stop_codon:yes gene_type:complete